MISKVKKFNCFFIGDSDKLLKKLQSVGIVEIESVSLEGFEKKKVLKEEMEDKINKIEFLKKFWEKKKNLKKFL